MKILKIAILALCAFTLSNLPVASAQDFTDMKALEEGQKITDFETHTDVTSGVINTCFKVSGVAPWSYCVYESKGSQSKDVLYYFHGIGGSEHQWGELPGSAQIYQMWGSAAPKVITISYGPAWLLAQKNESAVSGLYEYFVHASLPFIEKNQNLHPARRLLFGLSMGGFNASQVYLKNPELFQKVAFACPALTVVGPYSGDAAIESYTLRTHADPAHVQKAMGVSAAFFPDEASWAKADPVAQASEVVQPSAPPIFISGGLQDEYGFFEGGADFVAAVQKRGAKATWEAMPGKHCTFDVQATSDFLLAQ